MRLRLFIGDALMHLKARVDMRSIMPRREKRTNPRAVKDAEWQAGVTPNSECYRVFCNGEPMPRAFAANETKGWVDVYDDDGAMRIKERKIYIEIRKCRD